MNKPRTFFGFPLEDHYEDIPADGQFHKLARPYKRRPFYICILRDLINLFIIRPYDYISFMINKIFAIMDNI